MNDDDIFARTYPDIRKLRATDDASAEMVRLMTEFAKAGMKLEARMEKIELRHASEDGEQKARGQMLGIVQWVVGTAIALGGYLVGKHLK